MSASARDFISDELLLDELEAGSGDLLASELVAAIGAERSAQLDQSPLTARGDGYGGTNAGSKRPSSNEPQALSPGGSEALPAWLKSACDITGETNQSGDESKGLCGFQPPAQGDDCDRSCWGAASPARSFRSSVDENACGDAQYSESEERDSILFREKVCSLCRFCESVQASPEIFACLLSRMAGTFAGSRRYCVCKYLVETSMRSTNSYLVGYLRACLTMRFVRPFDITRAMATSSLEDCRNCSFDFLCLTRDVLQFFTFDQGNSDECQNLLGAFEVFIKVISRRAETRELQYSLLKSRRFITLARICARRAETSWSSLQTALQEVRSVSSAEREEMRTFAFSIFDDENTCMDAWLQQDAKVLTFGNDAKNFPSIDAEQSFAEMLQNMNDHGFIPSEALEALALLCRFSDLGLGAEARYFTEIVEAFVRGPVCGGKHGSQRDFLDMLSSTAKTYVTIVSTLDFKVKGSLLGILTDSSVEQHLPARCARDADMVDEAVEGKTVKVHQIEKGQLGAKQETRTWPKRGRASLNATKYSIDCSCLPAEFVDPVRARIHRLGARVLPAVFQLSGPSRDLRLPLTIAFGIVMFAFSGCIGQQGSAASRFFERIASAQRMPEQCESEKVTLQEYRNVNSSDVPVSMKNVAKDPREKAFMDTRDGSEKEPFTSRLSNGGSSYSLASCRDAKEWLLEKIASDLANLAVALMQCDIREKWDMRQNPRFACFGLTGAFIMLFLAHIPTVFHTCTANLVRDFVWATRMLMMTGDPDEISPPNIAMNGSTDAKQSVESAKSAQDSAIEQTIFRNIQLLVVEHADACGIFRAHTGFLKEISELI